MHNSDIDLGGWWGQSPDPNPAVSAWQRSVDRQERIDIQLLNCKRIRNRADTTKRGAAAATVVLGIWSLVRRGRRRWPVKTALAVAAGSAAVQTAASMRYEALLQQSEDPPSPLVPYNTSASLFGPH